MKIHSAEFTVSAVAAAQYPSDGLPEIALVGRSNVGKSSMINRLVNRRNLAKTSSTPGKTRTINFYRINNAFYLVDLPGYGYAKVPVSERRAWKGVVERYFRSRRTLKAVVVVLDPRRDPGELEGSLYRWLAGLEVPVLTVLTKCDKLSANRLFNRMAAIKKELGLDEVLAFSSLTGRGKVDFLKKIDNILKADPA